jgi:vacuolar-type H+-ATPase subunit H
MTRPETDPPTRNDEFSRIFSEYRARIDEITRRTEKKFKSLNDHEETAPVVVEEPATDRLESPPPPPVEARPEEPEEEEAEVPPYLGAVNRHYRGPEVPELRQPSEPESIAIIREARQKAKIIIEEAEQKIKKEARKKTQSQVDKLLEKARKEAEDIVAAAASEKNNIVAASRQEAEQAVADITGKCRQVSQAKSSQAIGEAREKAQKMMADVIESATEINRLIGEIIDRAGQTLAEFETKLREETGDLAGIITETRSRLEQVTAAAREEEARPAAPAVSVPREDITAPTLAVRLLGEKSNGLFRGQVEMRSFSATDYQHLKNLKKYLVSIPDVKYLQEYASEKEMSVLFDIREPLPLLDVLRQVPLVEDIVAGADDEFSIVFRSSD